MRDWLPATLAPAVAIPGRVGWSVGTILLQRWEPCSLAGLGRLCLRLLFARRGEKHAGYHVEIGQTILDRFHARSVLCGHNDRLACAFVGDRAPEFHGAISDDDIDERCGRPRLPRQLRNDAVADGLIARRSWLDLASDPGERVHQIGAAD